MVIAGISPALRASVFGFALLVGAVGAAADSEQGQNPDHEGYGLYQSYCAECHGVRADGQGPGASALEVRPSDLTRLREQYGELLRMEWLTRIIDGRRTLRAHGPAGMPVWGDEFVADQPDFHMRERARIQLVQSLAEYVLSIQRE